MPGDRLKFTWWLLVVGVCVGAPSPGVAGSARFWPGVSSPSMTISLAPGITYSAFRVLTGIGPLSIHQLRVDLSVPGVRIGAGLARGRLMSDDETTSSMVARAGAIAGVNGDFFDIRGTGIPLNIVVRNGEFLRSPSGWSALAIGKDGRARIVRYRWTGSVIIGTTRASFALDGYNTGVIPGGPYGLVAVSNTLGYGAPVPTRGVRQTVVDLRPARTVQGARFGITLASAMRGLEEGTEHTYTVRRVWSQTPYYAPFPHGAVLLIGRGKAADWLSRRMSPGVPVNINLTTTPDWRRADTVIGGGPWLLEGGRMFQDPYPPANNEWNRRYPVTAVGVSPSGRQLLFVEIDGRQPRLSVGLTRPQLAAYMQWLGVAEAMAFDSGGSATMVVRFPSRAFPSVVNSPSDGHERPVADAVLVFHTKPPAVRVRRTTARRHLTGMGHQSRLLPRCCATAGPVSDVQIRWDDAGATGILR